jgi:hypothetical protein
MSNFRAIATVTATLQRVLQDAIHSDVAGSTVTTVRPSESANLPVTGVNIYLYAVAQNPHRSNLDLPTRGGRGNAVQRPQIALDLNYLLSFYGDEPTLEPQRLLGSAAAFLHSQPLITRTQIEAVVGDASKPFLAQSDLAEQPELVRFTPLPLSLEELSRLWSVMLQTQYVLSVAYRASVVLIEREVTVEPALPTRAVNLGAIPLRQPFIRRIVADANDAAPILPGSRIRILGDNLSGLATQAQIDSSPVANIAEAADDHITLDAPVTLSAGAHSAQILQGVRLDSAGPARMALKSNLGAFVVHPAITETGGRPDIAISNVQGSGVALRSASVSVNVAPPVAPGQLATLELMRGEAVAFTFASTQPRPAPAAQIAFSVSGVPAGDYLFRVRVDGAESALDLDAHRDPVGPKATIP